jgi:hypothetical protein
VASPDDMNFSLDDEDDDEVDEVVAKVSPTIAENESSLSMSLPNRRLYNVEEILESDEKIEYAVQGLLPTNGLMYLGARSGTGKSLLAIQMAVDLVLGRDTMTLKRGENLPQQRLIYFSLEMGKTEFKERFEAMYPNRTEEEKKLLRENLLVYCDPEPFRLWLDDHAADMVRLASRAHITGQIIDTASVSFGSTLTNQEEVNKTIENMYVLRNRIGFYQIIPCHTRKLQAGVVANLEDITVDEIFGHSGVAQSASSVLLMHTDKKKDSTKNLKEGEKVVWLMNPKTRFAPEFAPFKMVLRTDPLQFRRDAIELPPMTPKQRQAAKSSNTSTMADAMKVIDFGNLVEEDDI